MNYNSLYSYTKDIINNIDNSIKWFHGRRELITQLKPEDTVAFCLPFISTGSVVDGGGQIAEVWEVNVIFYKKDQMPTGINQNDEEAQQVEIQVLSATTDIADEFVRKFDFNEYTDSLEASSEKLDLLSFSKSPAIKDTAHILTGTVVTMRVQVPDDFDYCVSPGIITPTNFSLTMTGVDSFTASWDSVAVASGYELDLADNADFNNSKTILIPAGTTSYSDDNEDGEIYARIRAFSGSAYSDYTSVENITFNNFITTWSVSDGSVTLPTTATQDFYIDWGDGNEEFIESVGSGDSHNYSTNGTFQVRIQTVTGTFQGFQFNNGGDRLKLTNVSQCGVLDISTSGAFYGCTNMTWTATDAPTISTTNLQSTFRECDVFNGNINNWDVSGVENVFAFLFGSDSYNQPLNNWNTLNFTNIQSFLGFSNSFDQNLSNWNISSVTVATGFLSSVTLSTANYDATLASWGNQAIQSGVTISFGNSLYTINSAADTARDSLQITNGWTITDGGAVGAIAEFNTLISTGYTSGYQPVMGANKAALSTFMSSLDSDGILDKLDVLYLFATSGDANFALLNLVDATAFEATVNGTVTFTANEGYQGDGSTGYLDWGWSPSDDGVNYQLNSASIFSYNTVNAGNNKILMGTRKGSGDSNIWLYSTSGNIESPVNVTSTLGTLRPKGTSGNTTGFFAGDRSDVNTVTLYEGGVQQAQVTASTSELSAGTPNMLSLALNDLNAGIGFQSSGKIQIQGAGASLTATEHVQLNNAINAYLFGLEVASPQVETTTYLEQLDTNNYARPSVDNCVALDTLISGLKTDGIFSKLDVLYMFATDSQAASLVNLITPASFEATAVNSPTFTANEGWTGDGVSAYIDSNYNQVDDGVNLTRDDGAVGYYTKEFIGASYKPFISNDTGQFIVGSYNFETKYYGRINGSLNYTYAVQTGLQVSQRIEPNVLNHYENGVFIDELTSNPSTALTANNIVILKNITSYNASKVQLAFWGASLTATEHANLNTRINTYLTSVGAI